ncbi:hypothetical protein LCGC14_0509730 [marine sediment metagenome]|uniref:Uncharacterized protein n=1 Tax=marine sediment metagenome TaxID=412755 RepID=A0A0F9SK47_9ZZZZ|nr:hypothetical protein [bacterium]
MRFSNVCDGMNITGCTEFHNWVETGKGLNHFLYVYQIESAFVSAFLLIGVMVYFILRKVRKSK